MKQQQQPLSAQSNVRSSQFQNHQSTQQQSAQQLQQKPTQPSQVATKCLSVDPYKSQLIQQLQQRNPNQQTNNENQPQQHSNFYQRTSGQSQNPKGNLSNQYVQSYTVSNPQKQSSVFEHNRKNQSNDIIFQNTLKNQADKRQSEQQIARYNEENYSSVSLPQKVFQQPPKSAQNLMSPRNSNIHENSMLFHSPAPRSAIENKGKVLVLQSPGMSNNFKQPLRQTLGQANINYTTTAALQAELHQQKDNNNKLLQKIQQVESEISRGMSKEFLKELESKIEMLQQLNRKLQTDNTSLVHIIDNTKLKEQFNSLTTQKHETLRKINEAQAQLPLLQENCEDLQIRLSQTNEQENWEIRELVNELENKVQGLIVENERLDSVLKDKGSNEDKKYQQELKILKLEVEKIQLQYQNQKFDEDNLKAKCKELERKYNQVRRENSCQGEKEWSLKINDLENKVEQQLKYLLQIQLLVDENEKLNDALNDPENTKTDIADLEDRINVIRQNNKKMQNQIDEQKKRTKKH